MQRPIDWDGTGECTLEFQGNIDVTFIALPDTGLMVAHSAVTLEETILTPAAMRLALTLNHTQLPPGFTLALDDNEGQFALVAVLHDRQALPDEVAELLDGFNTLVPQLREQLGDPAAMGQDSAPGTAHFRY